MMKKAIPKDRQGFTLVEVIMVVAILSLVMWGVSNFAVNIINMNKSATQSLTAQFEARRTIQSIISELRTASQSATGTYTIESAATSSVVFYADIDSDTRTERIRYFVDTLSGHLMRGVVVASGNPPAYPLGTETFTTLATNLSNSTSTPVFDYYDTNYAGTSSPMALPADVSLIRLVRVTLQIDEDPTRDPPPLSLSSEVTLRNLKDNL